MTSSCDETMRIQRGNNDETMRKQEGNNEETMRKQEGHNEETSICVNAIFTAHKFLKFCILLMINSLSINHNNKIMKLRNKL